MTTLFDVEQYSKVKSVYDSRTKYDPYWDEIVLDCSAPSADETGQLTLFYDSSAEPPDPDDYEDIEDYEVGFAKWRSHNPDVKIEYMTVLEDEQARVSELPELRKTQWVEQYCVKTKFFYYRYCYYDNRTRKIYHIHIPGGNYQSAVAIQRKQMIEKAIALGKTPIQIQNFIRGGFGRNGNKLIHELLPSAS